jgi:hypothetical protein
VRASALSYAVSQAMRFIESLPEFSREMVALLAKTGEPELATPIADLEIVTRCSCNDELCASFYTAPKPRGSHGPMHRNLALGPADGMIILDLVDNAIVPVEVIDRPDVASRLAGLFP